MKCEYCGQECADGLSFCSKCGKTFKRQETVQKQSSSALGVVISIIVVTIIFVGGYSFVKNIDTKNRTLSNATKYEDVIETKEKSDQNASESNEKTPENTEEDNTVYSVVEAPQYDLYEVQKYNMSFEYPNHFIKVANDNEYSVLSLKDPNNAAVIDFYGTDSIKGAIAREVADILTENIEKENSKLLDESFDGQCFYKKYRIDNTVYIIYGIVDENGVYFFNFMYAEFEEHVYNEYFTHIKDNFKVTKIENII